MTNIEGFISTLETEFDELDPGTLRPETKFTDLDEWSSMHSLIIIALIDTEYGVTITGEDLMSISNVEGLYNIVKSRQTH
ncbi:acyl carrier protein [Aequorivita sp. H23M31]|uniref:Acyl carrier protein n=1 Tax=Aequorivita ciconiae TaxID=2494375 RepID=A0A410G4B9_9FLAO|nr:acyl carrier protein [Aequorivita sp. H23M31]QAA82127.1 acyl carrier protein [Aequorivita sp. H23M31]